MILLKANNELKMVFSRMIKTMGVNVTWSGKFVVLNNFLILSGNVRSLIFNYDNRKVITNVIELPDRDEDAEAVEGNEILTNVLNMALYAFGKWGVIKGLKVDQDYSQLNELFQTILKDLNITPGFRDDNFRFYKNSIQITYEEVIQAAVEEGKRKAQEASKEAETEQPEERLGLWHKICWKAEAGGFAKSRLTAYEKRASRLGNNFYRTGFHCCQCSEKLFMAVYPEGEEFLVETEEGKVYLARCYTCDQCNAFYTPKPGKLLIEGDIYSLKFGGDRAAYEDYQELLGQSARRTTNYHFNEFEWERGKVKEPETIEEACAGLEEMSEEELLALDGKLEAGFYPQEQSKPYQKRIQELLGRKEKNGHAKKNKTQPKTSGAASGEIHGKGSKGAENEKIPTAAKKEGEKRALSGAVSKERRQEESTQSIASNQNTGGGRNVSGTEREARLPSAKIQEKYQARMKVLERMSARQLKELQRQIETETGLDHVQKEAYGNLVGQAIFRKEEEALRQKIKECQEKPYGFIARTMEEVEKSRMPQVEKAETLNHLLDLKKKRGEAEIEQMMASMPANLNRRQYQVFREKLTQYPDVDSRAYQQKLEEKRRQTEKAELESMLRRVNQSDRKGLSKMLKQLREGFSEEEAAPIREQIESRIRSLDEEAIDKICPNIMGMTFDEAAEAYEKIEGGAFLPELKTNTLEMIDKRLTKIKMDECALLVEKLKTDLKDRISDMSRLHFYEARKVMRGDWEPKEAELAARALNAYASDRSRYEFPILICDSSPRKNGREGFLLTPDHLFYNSAFNSEKIPVHAIVRVEGNSGLLNRGVYVNRGNGVRTKLPGGVPAKEMESFANVLDKFVDYLQEKPESRSISYLAKEKHEVKCCYRCGYTYRGGNVCPKCGNQANQ